MYCTPCARLMRSITPNTRVTPASIRTSTTPSCSPLRICPKSRLDIAFLLPPPAKRLSDSHISEPQVRAVLDALEVAKALAHDAGAWLAVIAGPPAKAGDHPSGEGERPLWIWVLLLRGFAFELSR